MKLYDLLEDMTGLVDIRYAAEVVKFPDSGLLAAKAMSAREFDLPETLYCEAAFSYVKKSDYPYTHMGPVMSQRMYDVLAGLGLPKHRTRPVVMLDDTVLEEKMDPTTGKPKPWVVPLDGYVWFHLMEHTDAFDKERSEYTESRALPGKINIIRKMVLKMPETGFPPIFRLPNYKRLLIVTEKTKQAFEDAGIVGCVFEEIEHSIS